MAQQTTPRQQTRKTAAAKSGSRKRTLLAVFGAVVASGGRVTWAQRGSLDGQPEALTATDAATVHAATKTGVYTSTSGGRAFQLRHCD